MAFQGRFRLGFLPFPLHPRVSLRWSQYISFRVPTGYIRDIQLIVDGRNLAFTSWGKGGFIPLKKQGFSTIQTVVGNGISEPSTVLLFQRIPPFKVPEMFGNMDIFMKTNTHLRELNPPKKKYSGKKVLSIFGCQVSSYGQSATSGELKFCKDAGLWYWQSSMPASYHPQMVVMVRETPLNVLLETIQV